MLSYTRVHNDESAAATARPLCQLISDAPWAFFRAIRPPKYTMDSERSFLQVDKEFDGALTATNILAHKLVSPDQKEALNSLKVKLLTPVEICRRLMR